jgi:predicted enzyme related to lactoylglutathione lyase
VQKAPTLGGKVLMPPMDIPTVGRMAVIQDPQGAVISIITYAVDAK